MQKTELLEKLEELDEFMQYVISSLDEVEGITESQKSVLTQSKGGVSTALTLIKGGKDLPPAPSAAPQALPKPKKGATVKYLMNLDGTFKEAKGRVVSDFAKMYAERLDLLSDGVKNDAAKMAGLHPSNYIRALKRATQSGE